MKELTMISKRGAFGLLLSASIAQSLGACAHHHHHLGAHEQTAQRTIEVTGAGEARGAPDVVRTSIGVEARAASAQDALQEANARIAQVIQTLKQVGISDADLRTHGFSVSYDREYVPPSPPPAPASAEPAPAAARSKKAATAEIASAPAPAPAPPARGSYVVNNQLEVTLREVAKLGAMLSAVTSSGANNIWGINFDLADKQPLVEKARAQAIENALADAKRVAALAGVKLGKIVRVSDGAESGGPGPVAVFREKAMSSNSVPVQEGELTINHQVALEIEIVD
jgi:uncharacterized protein YggE